MELPGQNLAGVAGRPIQGGFQKRQLQGGKGISGPVITSVQCLSEACLPGDLDACKPGSHCVCLGEE